MFSSFALYVLAHAAASAATTTASCAAADFPVDLAGIECVGMQSLPNVTTLDGCRAACCAAFPCTVFELLGTRCFISDTCAANRTGSGWVGGSTGQARPPWPAGNPCHPPPTPWSDLPFCNASLGIDARVADLVSRLPLSEKIGQLGGPPYKGAPSVGIGAFQWWNEATVR